ncbi:MAG: hypothetical protein B0W54_00505 [Cellvibrio sp. 79]|nr:MAG: hypothetical protein B0W54_00505 [Cellvibrio sp. 79]
MKIEASTKPSQPNSPARFKQLGGMMIESLIGLLILSVVGGGVMHASARMSKIQQQQTVDNIAVNQMRTLLMTRTSPTGADLCANTGGQSLTLPGETVPVAMSVKGCGNANFTINNVQTGGATLPAQPIASVRPVVLEIGSDTKMVRIGGSEVKSIATP